tara:strand:- start:290 stop:781 length:492 start_codon:yes stop_codon:yes gene_type:complete
MSLLPGEEGEGVYERMAAEAKKKKAMDIVNKFKKQQKEGLLFGEKEAPLPGDEVASVSSGLDSKTTGDLAGKATKAATGSELAGSIMAAGVSSGFNPVVMGIAAGVGILSAAEKRKQRKREAEAGALKEKAKGMEKKAEIQGKMAKSISDVLGGSNRIRGVNL